ncbi:MAG: threonylcarbamoyl-AMP synthase [Gammaproteobacteria bacterium]|nr:MAG: threonylcarbamoyl-AMP synthase [Gammaproteobacteria bacterium]
MASDFSIRRAAYIIRCGGIIAYPTETIYGLGCNPLDAAAVEKINTIKQRPLNKQFILLAGHIDQIKPLINLSDEQENLIRQTSEPTSWIVDASTQAPAWLTSPENTLTIRISKNNLVKKLCHTLRHAVISTSANLTGKPPAKNNLEIQKYFGGILDMTLATNKKLNAKPSKIIRLCDNHIIRN